MALLIGSSVAPESIMMRFSRRAMLMHLALGSSYLFHPQGYARDSAGSMDFRNPDFSREMRIVNDDVMGGRSLSRFMSDPEGVIFEGMVSLENNGGFASMRCPADIPQGVSSLKLTSRGDGKRYQLILRTEVSTTAPLYKCQFDSSTEWSTHQCDSGDFEAVFRGRPVSAKPLVFSEAKEFGILIADKQAGAFRIQLGRLEFI